MLDFFSMTINNIPLLSIITVNYNNADGLKKTMQSVLDLEFEDYEYIIIDGGSSDESVNVIKYYLENTELKDKVSYWCSEKDKGIFNAMNKGISYSHGKLLNFMNSGDTFISDSLNGLEKIYNDNKNAVLYGAINKVKKGVFLGTTGVCNIDINNGIIWHQATLIPKKMFLDYGLYDEKYRIRSDYEFFFRLLKNNVKFVFTNRIICNYDFSGISSTNKKLCNVEGRLVRKIYNKEPKKNYLKVLIKFVLPYGLLILLWKIKDLLKQENV